MYPVLNTGISNTKGPVTSPFLFQGEYNTVEVCLCVYAHTSSPCPLVPSTRKDGSRVGWTYLGHGLLASSTTNTDPINDISLLCLVAQAACFVGAARSCQSNNAWQLAILPAPHTEKKAEHIALLFLPQFLNVLRSEKSKHRESSAKINRDGDGGGADSVAFTNLIGTHIECKLT